MRFAISRWREGERTIWPWAKPSLQMSSMVDEWLLPTRDMDETGAGRPEKSDEAQSESWASRDAAADFAYDFPGGEAGGEASDFAGGEAGDFAGGAGGGGGARSGLRCGPMSVWCT